MKWIYLTGTTGMTTKRVEIDVHNSVREILSNGNSMIVGGTQGVELFAMTEMLAKDPTCTHIRVILPAKLPTYIQFLFTKQQNGAMTQEEYVLLENALNAIQKANPSAILELKHTLITSTEQRERVTECIKYCDEVFAFQVESSQGTQETVLKAADMQRPIVLYKKYTLQ